jgi:succinyl-diaminopimelate desuccinylase
MTLDPRVHLPPIELLKKLISIPSPYPHENPLAEWIGDYLKQFQFHVTYLEVKGRKNIVAKKGTGKALLLFGHLDTVPLQGVEDLNPHAPDDLRQINARASELRWESPPYEPSLRKGKLYGSGAIDMKAGLAAIIHAGTKLPEDYFQSTELILAFSVDEEFLDQGMAALLKSRTFEHAQGCICPEIIDTGELIDIPETPDIGTILLGRRGRIAIEVQLRGQAAHGATPSAGVNAIELAGQVVAHIKKSLAEGALALGSHPILPPASMTPLKIQGGTSSLSVPDRCTIEYDRHFVPPETPETVQEDLRRCLSEILTPNQFKISLAPRPTPYLMPYAISQEASIVNATLSVLKARDIPITIAGGNSVADENMLASPVYPPEIRHNIPTVDIGCKGGNFHKENEWVDLESFQDLASILKEICIKWAN